MKKRTRYFLLFACLTNTFLFAQKETYNFYFGADAIGFTSGAAKKISPTKMSTHEGSAAISDNCTGELLFYTNGVTIWNKNHQPMPNGSGLLGCMGAGSFPSSTTQSAIIVPKPGNKNIYYVFTNDCQENKHAAGFRYSIVDMSLNGGTGDVTIKNVLLFAPSSEKVTAVHHSNKTDIWIITHENGNSRFRSYLLTSAGLSLPVISNIGATVPTTPGYLKISSDGKFLTSAHYKEDFSELFEFDNSTGFVSNLLVTFPQGYYGVSFSPDASKLYMCNYDIHQYDLSVKNSAAILASKVDVTQKPGGNFFSLQQGPDKKIYCNGNINMHVINNPNMPGLACNIQKNIFTLKGLFRNGITNFVESFFDSTMYIPRGGLQPTMISSYGICVDSLVEFSFVNDPSVKLDSVRWSFSNSFGTSNEFNPAFIYLSVENINVQLVRYTSCGMDTTVYLTKSLTKPEINIPDTFLCNGKEVIMDFNDSNSSYAWNDGWDNEHRVISQSGTYWVTVENACGTVIDTFNVSENDCEPLLFIPNTFLPSGNSVNNIFKPVGLNAMNYELLVFNRWGELLFRSESIDIGWDGLYNGKICQQDVYVWKIKLLDVFGEEHSYVGHVNLIK